MDVDKALRQYISSESSPMQKSEFETYCNMHFITLSAAGLAQSVEHLTAEREVAGSIPGAGPLLKVLKELRNEGTLFSQATTRPSRGSDDHVKWRSRLH